jgi:pimeloyl-ACP methyl ester carboxylesterase
MATVRTNGVTLQVGRHRPPGDDATERPIVVFVHGLATVDQASFAFTLGLPTATYAEVVLYDLRGHGRSEMPSSGYRVADHVADLIGLLDGLGVDRPVHLVGTSYGGCVVLNAAREHPERVASVVLVEGYCPYPDWGSRMAATVKESGERLRAADVSVEELMLAYNTASERKARQKAARTLELMSTTTLTDDLLDEHDLADEDYGAITAPVLCLAGDRSDIYDVERRMVAALPDATLRVFPGATHFLLAERTDEVRFIVQAWIKGLHTHGDQTNGDAAPPAEAPEPPA